MMRKSNLFLLLWALVATAFSLTLWLQSSTAFTFFAPKNTVKNDPQQEFIFLRQFVLQYFSYDSENFRQTQASLTNLMQPSLRERRLDEISLLQERSEKKSFRQTVEILNIEKTEEKTYQVTAKVTSYEEAQKNEIYVNVGLLLGPSDPSAENPWNYAVADIVVKSLSTPTAAPSAKSIALQANQILTLQFPCAIENVSGLSEELWTYKIITTQTSEVQLSLQQPLVPKQNAQFNCGEQSFELTLESMSGFPVDIYRSVPLSTAKPRTIPRKKESLDQKERKSLENELNFIISE